MVKNIANYSLIALKKIWRFNYNSLIAYDVQELFSFNFNILFFSLLTFKLINVIRHNCYNCQIGETFPNMHYLFKSNNRNTRTMYEICSNLKARRPQRRHWASSRFLLLTLNRVHTLLRSFNCWLWTSKCRLGKIQIIFVFLSSKDSENVNINLITTKDDNNWFRCLKVIFRSHTVKLPYLHETLQNFAFPTTKYDRKYDAGQVPVAKYFATFLLFSIVFLL